MLEFDAQKLNRTVPLWALLRLRISHDYEGRSFSCQSPGFAPFQRSPASGHRSLGLKLHIAVAIIRPQTPAQTCVLVLQVHLLSLHDDLPDPHDVKLFPSFPPRQNLKPRLPKVEASPLTVLRHSKRFEKACLHLCSPTVFRLGCHCCLHSHLLSFVHGHIACRLHSHLLSFAAR